MLTNHGREMIAHPRRPGALSQATPIWEEMREVALRTNPTFLLNVTPNTRREITGVFADMLAAHAAGRLCVIRRWPRWLNPVISSLPPTAAIRLTRTL